MIAFSQQTVSAASFEKSPVSVEMSPKKMKKILFSVDPFFPIGEKMS